MLDNFNKLKFKFKYKGQVGLPEHYPTPQVKNLLFYIQRNLNINTVAYSLDLQPDGTLNQESPIDIYWVNYEEEVKRKALNNIQKLAFGCKFCKINHETFKFNIVSYPLQEFFLTKNDQGTFKVFSTLQNEMSVVSNIYVYAEEFGVFPQIKFIEFFGNRVSDDFPTYQKIEF